MKVLNNSKVPLPIRNDGVAGAENIVKLWRKYYGDIFNCVKRQKYDINHVPYNDVMIRSVEVRFANI